MTEADLDPQSVPLQRDAARVWRVAGTRVPLERVIDSYKAGSTAEEIAQDFDTLPLAAVHQVIAYYLSHREAVEAYLREAEAHGEQVREQTALLNVGLRWRPARMGRAGGAAARRPAGGHLRRAGRRERTPVSEMPRGIRQVPRPRKPPNRIHVPVS